MLPKGGKPAALSDNLEARKTAFDMYVWAEADAYMTALPRSILWTHKVQANDGRARSD